VSWIASELSTLPTVFIETISEGQKDLSKILEFSGSHEQRISYGTFMRRTYQITSNTLDATESAAFITFYGNHGNLTPFKFVYESETIYVRFDGGYVMDGTVADGIKKSVRFGLTEVNPAEIIT
jgi:hypothetical protein